MATQNLGRVAFLYRDNYNASTTYQKNDVVFDTDSSYISVTNNNTGNALTNTTYWKYLSKGNPELSQANAASITQIQLDLATKVTKTGNETIAGIKTFSSSPIVPLPTTDMQATTKKYVDDADAVLRADLNLDEYTIAEAFNLLYRKLVSLETIIANGVFKNLQVDNLTSVNTFNYNGAPLIVIGSTAPTSAPDFVGQTYVNTTAPGTVYSAKGNASVSDWKQTSN